MVMSRGPGFNSKKFYFSPNSLLNFKKKLPNLGEIGSRTKTLQAKNKLGDGTAPSAYRVKKVRTVLLTIKLLCSQTPYMQRLFVTKFYLTKF